MANYFSTPRLGTTNPRQLLGTVAAPSGEGLSGTMEGTLGDAQGILADVLARIARPATPPEPGLEDIGAAQQAAMSEVGEAPQEEVPGVGGQVFETLLNTLGGLLAGRPEALTGGFQATQRRIAEIKRRNAEAEAEYDIQRKKAAQTFLKGRMEAEGKLRSEDVDKANALLRAGELDVARQQANRRERELDLKEKDYQRKLRLANNLISTRSARVEIARNRLQHYVDGLDEERKANFETKASLLLSDAALLRQDLASQLQRGTDEPELTVRGITIKGAESIRTFIHDLIDGEFQNPEDRVAVKEQVEVILGDALDQF